MAANRPVDAATARRVPEAKVRPPAPPAHALARSRLLESLAEATCRRLTLLVAPAGSGKTTLLGQFSRAAHAPVCWYSCDPTDADPAAFATGLVAAAWTALHATCPALDRAQAAVAGGAPPFAALAVLVGALEEAPDEALFVVDDAHHVTPSSAAAPLLAHLVELLPDHVHVIIASRVVPAVPLILLTGMGQASGLGQGDLRFTDAEAAALLASLHGQAWTPERVTSLVVETQGWATALMLYGHLAAQAAGKPQTMAGAPRSVMPGVQDALFAYIATSVMAGLPARLRRFLYDIAVLDVFCPAEADALHRAHDSDRLLAAVVAQGLFLESLPDGRYRFHDLFRSFLQSHLRATAPERWRRLHRVAAAGAEQAGDLPAALRHTAEGDTPAALADLLERAASRLAGAGQGHVLIAWCERLPHAVHMSRPVLQRAHARALIMSGRSDAALVVLDRALVALGDTPPAVAGVGADQAAAHWLAVQILRANALVQVSRFEDTVATADTALLRAEPHSMNAAYLRQIRGCALVRLGRAAQGIVEVQQALDTFAQHGQDEQIAGICHNVGSFLLDCGDAHSALRYLDRAAQVKQARHSEDALGSTLLSYGVLHHLRGEFAEARTKLAQALALVRRNGHVLFETAVLESLGGLAAEQGSLDEAAAYLDAGTALAEATGQRSVQFLILCHRVRLCLAQDEVEQAAGLAAQAQKHASLPGEQGLAAMMAGLVAMRRGHTAVAIDTLQQSAHDLQAAGLEGHRARALLLLASVCHDAEARYRTLMLLNELAESVQRLGCEGFLHAEVGRTQHMLRYARDHPRLHVGTQALVERLLARSAVPVAPVAPSPAVGPSRRRRAKHASAPPPAATRPESVKPAAGALHVCALGRATVYVGDEPVSPSRWSRTTARELFFYALNRGTPLTRDEVVDALWPEETANAAQATFWAASHYLRRAVPGVVWQRHEWRYTLTLPAGSTYDVALFEAFSAAALDPASDCNPRARREAVEAAIGLYRGDYLDDIGGVWALPIRMRLHARALDLLLLLAAAYRQDGDPAAAVPYARRAVSLDPLEERAQRALIEACAAAGDLDAARQAYRAYRALLRDEIHEEPSADLRALYGRLSSRP